MTFFERFDENKKRYLGSVMLGYFFINNTINATSDWMEATRDGTPEFAMWEPFAWEYSSAISTLLLLPLIIYIWQVISPRLTQLKRQVLQHVFISFLFSVAHVFLMILMREGIYWLAGGNYNFGPLLREFFYEYRKDAWAYLFFFLLYQLYHQLYSRLKGEANLIEAESDKSLGTEPPEHFIVKKLDREFLVKVDDIEWMESSGNYVNLHSRGRIYPLRSTLSELSKRLSARGFSRVHRSFAVNHQAIDHISYLPSGDGEIQLRNGQKLSLSRRYKEEFKQGLC